MFDLPVAAAVVAGDCDMVFEENKIRDCLSVIIIYHNHKKCGMRKPDQVAKGVQFRHRIKRIHATGD